MKLCCFMGSTTASKNFISHLLRDPPANPLHEKGAQQWIHWEIYAEIGYWLVVWGGKKVQYIFSVLSGINSIPRADKAFERNLKAKMKHFCNILLLYVKHSHVSWMWIWALWSLGFVWTAMSALCDKAHTYRKQYSQYAILMHVCV